MDTTTVTAAGPRVARRPLLINRTFATLWAGQSASALGDTLFDTTLVLWIATRLAHGQPWAPLAVSGVLLATAIPTIAIGPLAGVFVDRWDRRRVMLCADALRALFIVLLVPVAGLVALPGLNAASLPVAWRLGLIYAVVLLCGVCEQFFGPARLALIGDVVQEADRPRATGLSQATMALAAIAGPPLAAPLFFGLGVTAALLANALSFALSFAAILAVRVPASVERAPTVASGVLREFGAGLRFFMGNHVLRTVLVTAILVMLGGGALNALGVFFVTANLHAPASLYGVLGMVMGVGLLVGAIVAGACANRVGVTRLFGLSTLLMGLDILALARLTSIGPALAMLVLLGISNAAVNVAVGPLLLGATPREFVGRVSAVLTPAMTAASLLSIVAAGYLASTVLRGFHATVLGLSCGSIDTILTGTGLLVAAGGLYALVNLRGVAMEASPR